MLRKLARQLEVNSAGCSAHEGKFSLSMIEAFKESLR